MTSNSLSLNTSTLSGDTDTRGIINTIAPPSTPSKDFDSISHPTEPAPPTPQTPLPSSETYSSSFKPNRILSSEMETEGATVGSSREGEGSASENKKPEVRVSVQDFPPSPPLTRTNTQEDTGAMTGLDISDQRPDEDWHPLKNEGSQTQHNLDLDSDEIPRAIVLDEGDSVVDSNGRVITPVEDLGRPRRGSHLHIEIKQSSPQPWDLVDPPSSRSEKNRNPYGTASSHRFSTLQDSARNRSLIPKSSYYFGPPGPNTAYGTPPVGQIGVHHPREVLRVERDYTGGELIQFAPIYPIELDGRITPTQFLESINAINELLISAHSMRHTFFDNVLAVFTLQLSRLLLRSHYEKEMKRLEQLFEDLNVEVFNPAGLNLLWPRKVAFLFLEIEYY